MITFKRRYFIITLILLVVEILIAVHVHDQIIRPYVGDFLVVIMIYCFIRTFIEAPVIKVAIAALLFAYLVEFCQYLDLRTMLGLQNSKLAKVILGHAFEWVDMLAYTLGIGIVLILENIRPLKSRKLHTT